MFDNEAEIVLFIELKAKSNKDFDCRIASSFLCPD